MTVNSHYSTYLEFPRSLWKKYRKETPLPLNEADLKRLQGQNEPVTLQEVSEIYLPLSRLLNLYVVATQELYKVTGQFLDHPEPKVPYIIGIAGSVAVGKSTTSRILKALLSCWPSHPHVELVTTDGFLYSNAILEERGLMQRKGFPESYDIRRLKTFLSDLKAGHRHLKVPIYSHEYYDIMDNKFYEVDQPDIVLVEGLNVLQVGPISIDQPARTFVSDYFDFSIYVDADSNTIKKWYLERFKMLRAKAANDPRLFLYQFAQMTEDKALHYAEKVWEEVNAVNLVENILPYKERAHLILEKGSDHAVQKVYLRKI